MKAFLLGVVDGWREPLELSSGLTWDDQGLNEWYDRGVNVGQFVRSPLHHQRQLLLLMVVLAGSLNASDRPKAEYKVLRIDTTQVGISCQNGADPTGYKVGHLLVISCGR